PGSPPPFALDRRAFLRRTLAAAAAGPVVLEVSALATTALQGTQDVAWSFLNAYNAGWLPLETAASEAAWIASTDVSDEHTEDQVAAVLGVSRFVGSPEVIERTKDLLEAQDQLDDLTARQLEKIRLRAAEAPGTIPEVVEARTKAEAEQSAIQDG